MTMNPREAALTVLIKIDKRGSYANKLLSSVFEQNRYSELDRAFINELVMGCIKNRILIDYYIMKFSKVRIKKMSVQVRNLLELGAYQILFLDRVPDSAACNESVNLAKKYAGRSAGFINGVLRALSRGNASVRLPDKTENLCEYLSVAYSYPVWIVEKLLEDYGGEFCEEILKSSNAAYPPAIRINPLKAPSDREELLSGLLDDGIDVTPSVKLDNCYYVNGSLDVYNSEKYKSGWYTIQNQSSQLVAAVLDPQPGELVIDVCAAPGGKTTHIAELMKNRGRIIAFDIHMNKIELIRRNAERLGISIIEAALHDSTKTDVSLCKMADKVLADVPCSGLGVVNVKPDIKYNRQPEDIAELLEIQRSILSAAAEYVRCGGVLVYSTCTIFKDENERQIEKFLADHSSFNLVSEHKLFTHKYGGSGFYIAKLKRS